ncbi:unnamed protein product [Closterium sp. Naga37s-1]|nr:unnamed protein product [Closterium sp. Naga37s-1]
MHNPASSLPRMCIAPAPHIYLLLASFSGQPYPRLTRASHEFTRVPGWAVASAAAPASEAAMACAAAMQPSTEALSYRIGGMLGILVSSIIGFALPFLLRGRHKTLLFFFRAMAAGIVLAVAIVHIFPGAQEALSNPCLDISSSPFPWAPVFILFSALFSFLVECYLKKLLLLSWRRKHPSAAATSAADSVGSAGGSSNRSGGKKRRLGAGGVGRVARVVAALLAGGRRKKGAGISKGGNGGGSGSGRGSSKRDGRLREDGKQQRAWQTDGGSPPDVACHASPPCCDAPCSAAAAACHDTACHDATCHDIPCHEVVCHDATCHDAMCPDVTCPEAICHDCPESTCHSTACHEITCHDATCHETTCQGSTCPDTTCPDNTCHGVTCLETTCPSAACGQSQCAGSKCVDSTCTDAKCIDAKCLAKCCETKCPACPDCALDVRPGEEEKEAMKTGKAEWEEQEGREESEESQMREAVALSSLRAVAYTLEMGIIFHSIFIGIALGANHDSAEIKGLAIALVFHQGFEGISLGTAVAPCRFSLLKTLCMGLLFAFTTPLGVAIGLAVHSSYNSNSQAALATEGAFNANRDQEDDPEEEGEEGSSEEESEEEGEEEKHKGVAGLIAVENPNAPRKSAVKISQADTNATTQLSRREREEIEKERGKERYMKLQEQGKTEQSKKDLERLALIRQQREEAAKKKEEERLAKEAKKLEARKR